MFYKSIALATALCLAASAASAVTTFLFTDTSTFPTTQDGFTLSSVSAFDETGTAATLSVGGLGLGVVGVPTTGDPDAVGDNESLILAFDGTVKLIGAQFVLTRSPSSSTVLVGSSEFAVTGFLPSIVTDLVGSTFSFKRTGGTAEDGFFLRSVTVSAIPLPPAALGLVSAFALAYGVRRKAKSAHA